MPGPIVSAHCERHGYDAPHVETAHGLRCLKCINERRAEHDKPTLTHVRYPFPSFELRFPYAMAGLRDTAARSGMHWEPGRKAWVGIQAARVEKFYAYADREARDIIDAWRADMAEKTKKVEEVYANGRR